MFLGANSNLPLISCMWESSAWRYAQPYGLIGLLGLSGGVIKVIEVIEGIRIIRFLKFIRAIRVTRFDSRVRFIMVYR